MKTNKLFIVALTATTLFASCVKEQCNASPDAVANKVLSVKVAGTTLKSKAFGPPASGTKGIIQLEDGVIFIIGSTDKVVAAEAIAIGSGDNEIQSANGQTLPFEVTADSRVYIAANIGEANVTAWTTEATMPANLADVNKLVMHITDEGNNKNPNATDYTKATLANHDAKATLIGMKDGSTTEAEVTVTINPVYSRMELVKVSTSSSKITSFKVGAVHVDDYYSAYTIGGSSSGTPYCWNQGYPTSTGEPNSLMTTLHDPAIASDVSKTVIPAENECWYFHVPSGNLPRLIIELTDIVAPGFTTSGTTYYLTVSGYNKPEDFVFDRGKVYRIGGNTGIEFDEEKISITPNPVDVELDVKVSISEWVLEELEPELQ